MNRDPVQTIVADTNNEGTRTADYAPKKSKDKNGHLDILARQKFLVNVKSTNCEYIYVLRNSHTNVHLGLTV